MNKDDFTTYFSYLIPIIAVIGFAVTVLTGEFFISIVTTITGILGWFLFLVIMKIRPPETTGNIITLFGGLLALGVFLNYGITQDMFGGFLIQSEGALLALIVLFFGVTTGILFNQRNEKVFPCESAKVIDDKEQFYPEYVNQNDFEEDGDDEDDDYYPYRYPPGYDEEYEEYYDEE